MNSVDESLLAIKGIGPWSAEFVLLRGLGRTEVVPYGERRLVEAASRLYGDGRRLTEEEIRGIAAPYGSCQGYWAHYLRVSGV